MAEVLFYHLEVRPLESVLPQLLEKTLERDWRAECAETGVLLRIHRDDGPDILTFTEAGGLARSGLNSAGIGLTANALGHNPVDDFLYGMDRNDPHHVVRVSAGGNEQDLGAAVGAPASWELAYVGTFLENGNYLVLGDNRDNSVDSRRFGFVPRREIVGEAKGVFVSADTRRWLRPRFNRFFTALDR